MAVTSTRSDVRRKLVMITDLDKSDDEQPPQNDSVEPVTHRKTHHKRRQGQKTLHTMSGNFNRRSRSAECSAQVERGPDGDGPTTDGNARVQSYFNDLLQTKDKQMEQLLQRLATLHKYNEQFSDENRRLHDAIAAQQQQIATQRRQIVDCERCRKLAQRVEETTTQTGALQTDVAMLKTLVYRLNVQIERYQDAAARAPQDQQQQQQQEDSGADQQPTPRQQQSQQLEFGDEGWRDALHTSTLAPLLQAYDEMLRDKEQLVAQYGAEFERVTGQLKRVLEENGRLLQTQESLRREHGSWREERTRLHAQLEVCRTKAETQTRQADLAKEKLVEVMHCYEQRVQTLLLDMEHMQTAYARCKAELAAHKTVAAQAASPQDHIVQSLQECKELLEQLKQQHNKERHTLEQQINELHERSSGAEGQVQLLRAEHSQLRTELEAQTLRATELAARNESLQRSVEQVKRSRDRLKARLRIALQWSQKLEQGQADIQSTWDALKRLETVVKHKESQVRGLHARHLEELDKMQRKLQQKEETIRTILKGKLRADSMGTTVK